MFGRDDNQPDGVNLPEPPAIPVGDLTVLSSTAPAVGSADSTSASTAPVASVVADTSSTSSDTTTDSTATPAASVSPDDLLGIKQEALQELQPLVGHLEQTPAEEFRTLMMMIQASDDQTLLKKAYASAQKITDDKARAQALLDVINEINYFTQHKS